MGVGLTYDLPVLVLKTLLVSNVAGKSEVYHGTLLRGEHLDVKAGDDDEPLSIVDLLTGLGEALPQVRERESGRGDVVTTEKLGCWSEA